MASLTASAPGKVILLGEHAVVYGKPALAMAIDLRFRCSISSSDSVRINGWEMDEAKHPYTTHILKEHWNGGIDIETSSSIPSGSGLGSSAALCASLNAAIMAYGGDLDEESCARRSFEAELNAQGSASPVDTSASVHGHGIAVNLDGGSPLWDMTHGERRWRISHMDVPRMSMVIGHTGISAPTGPLVAKVRRFYEHSNFAKDIVDEIGSLTEEAVKALSSGDKVGLGSMMTENHKLLAILGVSSRELDKLVYAVLPHSYGAKLTGAGGGGSMVALTDSPEKVCEAIKRHGGMPYVVSSGQPGVKIEK